MCCPSSPTPATCASAAAPLLLVYRVDLLPDPAACRGALADDRAGGRAIELHWPPRRASRIDDPRPYGFDAAVEFPPHPFGRRPAEGSGQAATAAFRGCSRLRPLAAEMLAQAGLPIPAGTGASCHRGTTPRGAGKEAYVAGRQLARRVPTHGSRELVRQALERADVTEPLVFVNAWNEWAEGTHLEPDDRYGRAWLEATRDGLADGAQAIGEGAADSARRAPVDRRLRQQKLPHGQNLKSAGTSRLNGCDRSLRSTSRARSGPLPRAFETRPWKIP